ncbi:MAG: hypothetical protein R3248_06665 [Candidatus Promineifilaceae bacterium]|nr:hypothetical protein [Candidatus Promineifilaceae bacterium]
MTERFQNPYVGPRTFEEEDGRFFYGRDREARTLISLVKAEPLLLFYAQSGAGKSSLVNTRLIPGLRQEGFRVLPTGRVGGGLVADPGEVGNIFTFTLLSSISQGEMGPSELAGMSLSAYLQQERSPATESAEGIRGHESRILIIDQFEEIVTGNDIYWQQREPFFRQITEALRRDNRLWILLVMREDYVPALDPYLHLLPQRLRNRFHMQRMGVAAAQEAIAKPASLAGRSFAPGVAQALVDNLRQIRTHDPLAQRQALGQFVEPVQLQVVCYQLWQQLGKRPVTEITMQHLEELGDVDTALAQFYEQAIETVLVQADVTELELRSWFERQLITEAGTRGTVFYGAEETAGLDNEIVSQLANQFILRAEMRAGGLWYELVHDRFVEPILQANQAWRAGQNLVIRAADEWDRAGRPSARLLQGERLQEALATLDPDRAAPIVAEFLAASQDAQNQRELAAAQEKAAADARRAEEEARRARRLRRITAVLVFALLFAVAGAVFAAINTIEAREQQILAEADSTRAVEQSIIANAESTRAVEQQRIAEAQSTLAIEEEQRAQMESTRAAQEQVEAELESTRAILEKATADAASTRAAAERETAEAEQVRAEVARATAEAAQAQAARQGRLLLAQTLAFAAANVTELGGDTELAMLLALEAGEINRQEQGDLDVNTATALMALLTRPYFNVTLRGHDTAVGALAYLPERELLASASDDGLILLWSLADPLAEPTELTGHDGAVNALHFADDQTLLSAGEDGTVRFWSLGTTPALINTLQEGNPVRALTLLPGGRQLVVSLDTGAVHHWELDALDRDPTELATWQEPAFRPLAVETSQGRLLAGNPSGAVQSWSTANVFTGTTFIGELSAPVTALVTSAEHVAFAGADGSIGVLRQTGLDLAFAGHAGAVNSLALTADGQLLASAGQDGTVHLWNMPGPNATAALPRAKLEGHEGPVRAVRFASGDEILFTAGDDGMIRLWRLEPELQTVTGSAPILFSPSGELAVTVTQDDPLNPSTLHLWQTTGLTQPLTSLEQPNGFVRDLAFSSDERSLYAALDRQGQGAIFRWTLETPSASGAAAPVRYVEYPVRALALSPDGGLLAAAGAAEGQIEIFPVDDIEGTNPIVLQGHSSAVTELAFTGDGQYLLSAPSRNAGGDGVLRWTVAEFAGAETVAPTPLTPGAVRTMAVEPAGERLAIAQDGIYLWPRAEVDAPPRLLPDSAAGANALAFSRDGAWLLAGGAGARLWPVNAPDTLPVTFFEGFPEIQAVALQPGEHRMLIGAGTISYLLPALDQLPQAACDRLRRNLTWEEWQTYLPGEPYRVTCPDFPPDPSAPTATGRPAESAGVKMLSRSPTVFDIFLLLIGGSLVLWRRQERPQEK